MNTKDYIGWHSTRTRLDSSNVQRYFHERQIWWVAVGLNIGFEENGKGTDWARPVLILVKFNQRFFYGLPLSSTTKSSPWYFGLN